MSQKDSLPLQTPDVLGKGEGLISLLRVTTQRKEKAEKQMLDLVSLQLVPASVALDQTASILF